MNYASFIQIILVNIDNTVHIICEQCNDLICDKCVQSSNHKGHKVLIIDHNSNNIVNIIEVFYNKIKSTVDERMTNFKEKINESEKVIDNFFNTELEKIEISSRELNNLIEVLTNKVKKLVNLYKIKFKEQFKSAKDEYEHFGDGVNECIITII